MKLTSVHYAAYNRRPSFLARKRNWLTPEFDGVVVLMSDFDDHDPLADTKEVFHAWVRSFDAFHDDEYLFEQLAYCEDLLTNELCDELGLKADSTYADAVDLFRSKWADVALVV